MTALPEIAVVLIAMTCSSSMISLPSNVFFLVCAGVVETKTMAVYLHVCARVSTYALQILACGTSCVDRPFF
jgi:hypothetical protein